jgi:hypothetical protein
MTMPRQCRVKLMEITFMIRKVSSSDKGNVTFLL